MTKELPPGDDGENRYNEPLDFDTAYYYSRDELVNGLRNTHRHIISISTDIANYLALSEEQITRFLHRDMSNIHKFADKSFKVKAAALFRNTFSTDRVYTFLPDGVFFREQQILQANEYPNISRDYWLKIFVHEGRGFVTLIPKEVAIQEYGDDRRPFVLAFTYEIPVPEWWFD